MASEVNPKTADLYDVYNCGENDSAWTKRMPLPNSAAPTPGRRERQYAPDSEVYQLREAIDRGHFYNVKWIIDRSPDLRPSDRSQLAWQALRTGKVAMAYMLKFRVAPPRTVLTDADTL